MGNPAATTVREAMAAGGSEPQQAAARSEPSASIIRSASDRRSRADRRDKDDVPWLATVSCRRAGGAPGEHLEHGIAARD